MRPASQAILPTSMIRDATGANGTGLITCS
jgi:hypothetical protein